MKLLQVENLSKAFGGTVALFEASFSLEAGERLAVIGPNGAGKTTLLNLLGGQLSPTSGQIYIRDEEITSLPSHERLQLGLARSFQLNNLFLNLSVLDNVLLALQGAKGIHFRIWQSDLSLRDLVLKAEALLKSMNLWKRRDLQATTLSYGEQRQMEVALGLASEPKILLLDEPCAGLAAAESANLMDMIRNLPRRTSVLFCEHDMDVVFDLADRIIVLNYGQIISEGSPDQIRIDPKVKKIYLGE